MNIHPTALIDPRANIDPTATIGPYVVIDGPVRIGAGTTIAAHAQVLGYTTIGNGCRIHAAAIIGDVPQDRTFAGVDSFVRIGDETVIREHVTIHRGTSANSTTVVGNRCMLFAHSHVAHNCQLGDDVLIVNGVLLGGSVTVGDRATISGNSAVHPFVRIGELSMIGGLTKITRDVPPFLMFDGSDGAGVGLNTVGLKRAGLAAEDRQEIKEVYKALYRTRNSLTAAIAQVETRLTTPSGKRLIDFLKTPSKRGIQFGRGNESEHADA